MITYFEQKAKEQKKLNIEGRKLAIEIAILGTDLGQLISGVVVHINSDADISSIDVKVYSIDIEVLFNTNAVYFTGSLCNLPKLKKLKASLERAVKMRELPEAL